MIDVCSQYIDDDTSQGIEKYKRLGLDIWTPDRIMLLNSDNIRQFAQAISDLIDSTYGGQYPKSTKLVESMTESILREEILPFGLKAGDDLIATASLVLRKNPLGGSIGFAELSKAAKSPLLGGDIQARFLSKFRLSWAAKNLQDIDFLYGSPRVAVKGRGGTQGGKQAQSIWWGGRRYQSPPLPILTTSVGWNFKVGGIEPLTGFTVPLNVDKWIEVAKSTILYAPNELIAKNISVLITEGTSGKLNPNIKVLASKSITKPCFLEGRKPSPDIVSKYYVTADAVHLPVRSHVQIDDSMSSTISQKVIVESDITTSVRGVAIMQWLLDHGWSFAGWQPSELTFGGIGFIFTRINAALLNDIIEPVHYTQYFNESGLGCTKKVLDGMYSEIHDRASQHKV